MSSERAPVTTTSPAPNANPPREEYPRPILKRPRWLNLNGQWNFKADPNDVGLREHWYAATTLPERITLPFTPEAAASGINDQNPAPVLWYHRTFECPDEWRSKRLLLHFGASDYHTRVFVNAQEVGQNTGGYAPFAFDIAHAFQTGTNHLSVRVADTPSWSQPRGKQAGTTRWPIDYDTVSGIWQTVWLEPLPQTAITDVHSAFTLRNSDTGKPSIQLLTGLNELFSGHLEATLSHAGKTIGDIATQIDKRSETRATLELSIPAKDLPLWSPDNPNLCDLKLRLYNAAGELVDTADSYLGLREITANSNGLELNGEPLYLRGVLDQGYFPEGWYTAPSDEHLRRDVELTKQLGFNCARKHQKAEDPRYLYWADRLGLLVWAEMPSGRIFSTDLVQQLTAEWGRLVRRDRGHPCVMAWVPFNESWGVWNQRDRPEQRAFVDALTSLTRALDSSRPVIGNDGWEYSSGDLWTLHLYEGDSLPLAERLAKVLATPQSLLHSNDQMAGRVGALDGADVAGLPVLLTECGGVGYQANNTEAPENDNAIFAYGDLPTTREELERRIRAIAQDIDSAQTLRGFVWTQLTDVAQEKNGLLTFERTPKLPVTLLSELFRSIGSDNTAN